LHVLEFKVSELEDFCGVFLGNTVSSGITRQRMIVANARRQNILIKRDCALVRGGVDRDVVLSAYKWMARQPKNSLFQAQCQDALLRANSS
jgi:hypothetical protein